MTVVMHRGTTRVPVLHEAVELLRTSQLSDAYAAAWDEWAADDETEAWDAAVGDGLTD